MGFAIAPTATGFELKMIPDYAEISKVIFNDPATVVIWNDGSKTVVKCQPGDTYSKETGLALCIAKKYLGNKGNFNEVFKKWIPEETEPVEEDEKTGDIGVGDKVRVINSGDVYPNYRNWIKDYVTNPFFATKWVEGSRISDNTVGIVRYIAPHENCRDTVAYVDAGTFCFMISVDGLERIEEA